MPQPFSRVGRLKHGPRKKRQGRPSNKELLRKFEEELKKVQKSR